MAPPPFTIHRFKEINSTNDWLLAAARGGAEDRTVVTAEFQRKGRGRLDRRWEAPPGSSLLMSVLVREPLPASRRFLVPVALGLSACEACLAVAALRVALKWPNDLVVDDRKLGGLLAETDGGELPAIVVGLGLNLTYDGPEGLGTSILRESGLTVARDDLLDAVLAAFDRQLGQLGTPAGQAALLDAWRLRLATLGRMVNVDLGTTTLRGRATGVTDEGHLVVGTDGDSRTVAAGDVVHVRTAE